MKLNIIIIVILGFSILFVTGQAYAPCIEGPGIDCNNYPHPSLSQIKTDKLNYELSDKPTVTITGSPDVVTHLEIDDLSSNIIFTHDINLTPNGTVVYALNISSYKPGVYTVIATSLMSKLTTSFTVGLAPTGGSIVLNTDRNSYLPGDNVIIVGTWNSNTMIQLSLIDPNGVSIKSFQTFSDQTGHFSLFNFTIPSNAISGIWKIGATSDVSYSQVQITINSSLDNNSNIKMDYVSTLSPLKQIDSGISTENIACSNDLELIYKTSNKYPACVKHTTAEKLVQRGWAIRGQPISYFVKMEGFLIPYDLVGGNMLEAKFEVQTNSIIFSVDHTTSSGVLYVAIPRALLDSKSAYSNQDTKFIILVDKQEIKYTETTSITNRTLSIPFDIGAKEIEITAPVGI